MDCTLWTNGDLFWRRDSTGTVLKCCLMKPHKMDYHAFGLLFSYIYVPTIFTTSRKKVLPKWTIYKHESDKIVIVVFCSMSIAYTSSCRGLKYLVKITYIIQDYANVARFLIFETLYLDESKTLPYVWIKYPQNERHLCLVTHSLTKHSQKVYLIDTHIL